MARRISAVLAFCVALVMGCCALALTGCGDDSDFAKYGIKADMEQGKSYDYTTICYSDRTKMTTGQAQVTSYQTVKSDANHAAKDGYEWRLATITVTFSDNNAWNYGFQYYYRFENYYDISLCESDSYDETAKASTFKLNYKNKDYVCTLQSSATADAWVTTDSGHTRTVVITFAAQVPEGYDGMVCGLMNAGVDTTATYTTSDDAVKNGTAKAGDKKPFNEYYNEADFLFFRMK